MSISRWSSDFSSLPPYLSISTSLLISLPPYLSLSHYLFLYLTIYFPPMLPSGVEKREEDQTSSVGDLLRDIETALDTVLDEREKQLQQQV